MPPAETASPPRTLDVLRPFATEDVLRRVIRLAELTRDSRVLELGCGVGTSSLFLARELGWEIVAADVDDTALRTLRERVEAENLAGHVDIQRVELHKLPFLPGAFDAVLMLARDVLPITEVLAKLRPCLATRGKLCVSYPVKVGRAPDAAQLALWEKKLGEPLRLPRELLGLMEKGGFEPEWVESLSDVELEELYQSADGTPALTGFVAEEASIFRAQAGLSSVTWAIGMGRRKEPGEKPPVSRDRG